MQKVSKYISVESLETIQGNDVPKMLVKAYCDERTAFLQYEQAWHQARGVGYCDVVDEYKQHQNEENEHAMQILQRLEQIGIIIRLDYKQISELGNPWTPITTSDVKEQLDILIKAEDDAANFYGSIYKTAREVEDFVTMRLIRQLMADEVEHKTDLQRIREHLG